MNCLLRGGSHRTICHLEATQGKEGCLCKGSEAQLIKITLPVPRGKKQRSPTFPALASDPITSWQLVGETMESVTGFIFLGSKITVGCDYSHEIKRYLLLGRKAMINVDSILKNRVITLPTKVCIVKAMAFPLVMYGCECWTI